MALPFITIKVFVSVCENTVTEILSETIELTLDLSTSGKVKAADLIMVANLRGALSKDNIEGAFHDDANKVSALFWPDDCCLALSLWAERNDALKLTFSLSIREHEVDRDIILLKESEHGNFNWITPRVINRLV